MAELAERRARYEWSAPLPNGLAHRKQVAVRAPPDRPRGLPPDAG